MATYAQLLAEVWTPHSGQREFLDHPSRIKVLACGRRWGKTDACAAAIVAQLLGETPTRTLILAPTLDQARMLFDRVVTMLDAVLAKRRARAAPTRPPAARARPRAPARRATTPKTAPAKSRTPKAAVDKPTVRKSPYPHLRYRNHVVMARSGHLGRALRGNEATHIVIDEAAYVPEELITEVAMPMLATTGGSLTLIGTPNGLNHFWRFYKMGETGEHGIWSRTGPSAESPYVSASTLAIQRELISERAFRVEYEAQFVDSTGCLFRTESIERCLVPELPAEAVRPPFCIGIDWGRYRDYSALVVLAGSREGAYLVESRRWSGLGWAEQCRQIADCLDRYPQSRVLCDATGLGDPAIERLREEAPRHAIRGLVMTASSKSEIVEGLAWLLEAAALRLTPDPDLLRELQHFEARMLPGGHVAMEARSGFHDDLVVALALACRQLPRSVSPGLWLGSPRTFSRFERSSPCLTFSRSLSAADVRSGAKSPPR